MNSTGCGGGRHTNPREYTAYSCEENVNPARYAEVSNNLDWLFTQNYRLLEASADPLPDSWYVGRDIGKVGYYVDARVLSIFEGADETLCLKVIARRLLD